MKPSMFICGPSGTGKSSSLRNLNPETTVILNTEQKALPFRGASKFKLNVMIDKVKKFHDAMKAALENDKVETIVVESFTSLHEMIFREKSKLHDGFELWGAYKDEISKCLHTYKNADKWIIWTGIDKVIEGVDGVDERFISVDGSWQKKVAKEFVIVFYSTIIDDEYVFITNKKDNPGYAKTVCKSPMEMYEPTISNDVAEAIKIAEEYYK